MSENLRPRIEENPALEIEEPAFSLDFDGDGNLDRLHQNRLVQAKNG
jgi:hypothetical protein